MTIVGDGRWLTVGEACRVLGVSRTTLLAAEDSGAVTPVRTPGGHRRYASAALRRYLGSAADLPDPPAPGSPPAPVDPECAAVVRAALRPLVHTLDAECAGLYRGPAGALTLVGAFGIPRWLSERLAERPPPPAVAAALTGTSARTFEGFPDPRSRGHGVAAGLHAEGRPLGVLFLAFGSGPGPLPAQLRLVEAFGEVLALLVATQDRAAASQERIERIAGLCGVENQSMVDRTPDR